MYSRKLFQNFYYLKFTPEVLGADFILEDKEKRNIKIWYHEKFTTNTFLNKKK